MMEKDARPSIKTVEQGFFKNDSLPDEYQCGLGNQCKLGGEPAADQPWIFCFDCKATFHAQCFATSHKLPAVQHHKKYLLPPRYLFEFDDVRQLEEQPGIDVVVSGVALEATTYATREVAAVAAA